jgi:hypothetical protein
VITVPPALDRGFQSTMVLTRSAGVGTVSPAESPAAPSTSSSLDGLISLSSTTSCDSDTSALGRP